MKARLLIGSLGLLVGGFVSVPLGCLGEEADGANNTPAQEVVPHTLLEPSVDDALIQVELSKLGGVMVERGQLLAKAELLKRRLKTPLELPAPSATPRTDADLAARCKESVVVVARLVRMGATNDWVALPATGFFISTSGGFVTSSHVIHNPDYEGMVVLAGDGRLFPVQGVIADDEECDVAVLKAEVGLVAALPLEAAGQAGTRVAVLSHPVGRFFTYTQGAVTRRSFQHTSSSFQEKLEISAEFGPGSSGAPVVNSYGNVIGWVATLRTWPNPAIRDGAVSPTLTFRECGVAGDILRLLAQIRETPASDLVRAVSTADLNKKP